MSRSWKSWISLLLALFLTFGSGCSLLRSGPRAHYAEITTNTSSHQEVGSKGEIAKWIFIGTILTAVVFVDLILLPATYHDPFPCCRVVIDSCG